MKIELKKLIGQNGKPFIFDLNEDIKRVIEEIEKSYNSCHDYNDKLSYRHNLIKTTISDIDIEEKGNTSYIESLAAICCNKIKNKNQKTAQNMLKILESNLLSKSKKFTDDYVITIWRELTEGNRNIVSIERGYRKLPVKLAKGGVLGVNKNIVYIAPKAQEVPKLINNLYDFLNDENIVQDNFYNIILKSIIFSAYFVYVHPFSDGNGRLSRLLTNKILVDNGLEKFKYISINSEIIKNKQNYNLQLQRIERGEDNDLTDYIYFMTTLYLQLLNRIANPKRKQMDYSELSDREKIMLNYIMGTSSGIFIKKYKKYWNFIAEEKNYKKISVKEAEKDLIDLFFKDFIVMDERYVNYIGFKYYNK